jgi:lysophospholipase L1-like esterase
MHRTWVSVLSVLLLANLALAQSATAPAAPQQPDVAAPKVDKEGKPNDSFIKKHEKYVERAKKGGVDLLFLGDSITEGWNSNGKDVWKERYGDKYGDKVANFGISGDRTQHVLWRITNGELENIKPKVIVIMIGTNNVNGDPPEKIAAGVTKIVQTSRDKTGAKILLLAVFPRGEKPDEEKSANQRASIRTINQALAKLDDGKNVRYLDLWDKFVTADGTLPKDVMPDSLHPNKKGYEIWADGMDALLNEMMAER